MARVKALWAEERWLYEMTDLMGKVDSGQDKGEAEAIL